MHNSITCVPGIEVGCAEDPVGLTGCTVILVKEGAVPGVDVRGSAPGTRETDLMRPARLVQKVHGIVLSGGSAFGLDAASGVMAFLEEQGIGFETGFGRVPIVGAAVIFDL
ncbi:MAG TPA: peptidase S58 family protein, partial [Firmicutes bacterium]|nr:peptidase S58 family protein [Bacillota bacterium]